MAAMLQSGRKIQGKKPRCRIADYIIFRSISQTDPDHSVGFSQTGNSESFRLVPGRPRIDQIILCRAQVYAVNLRWHRIDRDVPGNGHRLDTGNTGYISHPRMHCIWQTRINSNRPIPLSIAGYHIELISDLQTHPRIWQACSLKKWCLNPRDPIHCGGSRIAVWMQANDG